MEGINYELWAEAVNKAKQEIKEELKKYETVGFPTYTAYYIFKHHLLKNHIEEYLNDLIRQSPKYFNGRSWNFKIQVDNFKEAVKRRVDLYVKSYEEIVRSKQ